MLTEPFTAPATRGRQLIYATFVGILYSSQLPLVSMPSIALLIGNLLTFYFVVRTGDLRFKVTGVKKSHHAHTSSRLHPTHDSITLQANTQSCRYLTPSKIVEDRDESFHLHPVQMKLLSDLRQGCLLVNQVVSNRYSQGYQWGDSSRQLCRWRLHPPKRCISSTCIYCKRHRHHAIPLHACTYARYKRHTTNNAVLLRARNR